MQGKMNSRKEIKIRAFGSVMENSPENDFQCLVTFWKCYFPTNFSHFLSHFLSFQTNFISENFKIYTFNKTKNQNKNIFRTYTWYISGRRSKKEGECECLGVKKFQMVRCSFFFVLVDGSELGMLAAVTMG